MNDRSISFEKIFNARDMGGLRMAQGRVISSGLLIHSAHLSDSTEADRNVLREKYRLSKIIDLRTDIERNEMPDKVMASVEHLPIPIFTTPPQGSQHYHGSSSADKPRKRTKIRKILSDDARGRQNRKGSGNGT